MFLPVVHQGEGQGTSQVVVQNTLVPCGQLQTWMLPRSHEPSGQPVPTVLHWPASGGLPLASKQTPFRLPKSHSSPRSNSAMPLPQLGSASTSSLPANASCGLGIPPSDQIQLQLSRLNVQPKGTGYR